MLGAQTVMYLLGPPSVLLIQEGTGFQIGDDSGGMVGVPDPYDPVADAWWRLRGDPGVLHFDTSPDGIAWRTRADLSISFPLDHQQVTLGAGVYKPLPNPGRATFRCFNQPPPCS